MTKSDFRGAAFKCLALMIVVGGGFFYWMPLLWKTVCETPIGVICFPLHLFLMFVGVPLLVAVSAILLVRAVYYRATTIGLSPGWTVAMVVWLAGATVFLGFFAKIAQKGLSPTVLGYAAILAFAVTFIAFLSLAEPSAVEGKRMDQRVALRVAQLAALLAVVFAVLPIVHGRAPTTSVVWAGWIDCAIFSAALAYLIATQGGTNDANVDAAGQLRSPASGPSTRATFGRRAR